MCLQLGSHTDAEVWVAQHAAGQERLRRDATKRDVDTIAGESGVGGLQDHVGMGSARVGGVGVHVS